MLISRVAVIILLLAPIAACSADDHACKAGESPTLSLLLSPSGRPLPPAHLAGGQSNTVVIALAEGEPVQQVTFDRAGPLALSDLATSNGSQALTVVRRGTTTVSGHGPSGHVFERVVTVDC